MDTPLGKGLESLIPDHKTPNMDESQSSDSFLSEASVSPIAEPPTASASFALPQSESQTEDTLSSVSGTISSDVQPAPSSALPNARSYQDHFVPRRTDAVFWIELEKIEPNPYQPRRAFSEEALHDLANSIREYGLLQPVLVSKREIETPTGIQVMYELIAGERRWRAAKLAGLSQIPAIIRRGIPDDRLKLELAIIENVQREELNAIERANAFKRLIDEFHLVQREIAGRIGKSREMVANTLRLLALPQEIQQAVRNDQISEGHARAILMAGDDQQKQFTVYADVISDRLTVRQTENRARQVSGKRFTPHKRASKIEDPEMRLWQNRLQEELGTKVQLQRIGERGKIVVEFFSEEELHGLLHKLVKEV